MTFMLLNTNKWLKLCTVFYKCQAHLWEKRFLFIYKGNGLHFYDLFVVDIVAIYLLGILKTIKKILVSQKTILFKGSFQETSQCAWCLFMIDLSQFLAEHSFLSFPFGPIGSAINLPEKKCFAGAKVSKFLGQTCK